MDDYPPENINGHRKKTLFIQSQLENYVSTRGAPISLLDFGCGNGSAVSKFLLLEGVRYCGVDIHAPSLDYAGERYSSERAVFVEKPSAEARFDVVVYADVLEHLAEPELILREHHALMNDGGIIIGSVPNGYGPFEIEMRIDRLLGLSAPMALGIEWLKRRLRRCDASRVQPPYNYDSPHIRFFTRSSLTRTLAQAGFRIDRFRNGAFVGAPISGLVLRGETIAKLNAQVADYLPYWAVSNWYFTAERIDALSSVGGMPTEAFDALGEVCHE